MGCLRPATGRNRYNPHGCCHHIGLDVHDKGEYDILKEGMVITIEPGIYLPDIGGVRLEDTVVITANGYENLTKRPV